MYTCHFLLYLWIGLLHGGLMPQTTLAIRPQQHQGTTSSSRRRRARGRGLLVGSIQYYERSLHRRLQPPMMNGGSGGSGGGVTDDGSGGGGGGPSPPSGGQGSGGNQGTSGNGGGGQGGSSGGTTTSGQDTGVAGNAASTPPADAVNTTDTANAPAPTTSTTTSSGDSMVSQACQSAKQGTPLKTNWSLEVPYQYQLITNGSALQSGFEVEAVVDQFLVDQLVLKNCRRRFLKGKGAQARDLLAQQQICGVDAAYTVLDTGTTCQGVIVQAANICYRLKAAALVYLCSQPATNFDAASLQNQISQLIADGNTKGDYSVPANGTILGLQVLAVITNSSSNASSTNSSRGAAGTSSLTSQPSNSSSNDRSMSTAGIFFLTISILAVVSGGAYFAVRELQYRRSVSRGFRMEEKPRAVVGEEGGDDELVTPRRNRVRSTILTNDTMDSMSSASQYGTEAILADLRNGGSRNSAETTTMTTPRTRRTFGEDDESFSTSTSDAGGRGLYALDETHESFGYRVRVIPESEVEGISLHPDDDTYSRTRSYNCPNTVQL